MEEESITFEEVYAEIKENITDTAELAEIKKAYNFALKVHEGKKRLNGEDFITHPLNVAKIVNSLNVDSTTIVAALLHEVINNGEETVASITEEFGPTVATIVDSVSKINKLELVDTSNASAIYLRKVLVGLATDVRVLFIKLADRLHNMRTNYAIDEKKQKDKAYETQAVLIPIAHRLGINSIKSELEDLCLYYTKPDVYQDIVEKLAQTEEELASSLNEMQESITNILTEAGFKFKIKGRVKSVHSIYNKLSNGKKWNEIYDILALRVILESETDCYAAVGLVHAKYRPIPNRFKDYIAMPKANMYQSLHTTVFGVDGHLFEIQFRTYEMDEIAEKGFASHWSYKEKGAKHVQNIMEQKLEMFRNLIETHEDIDDVNFAKDVNSDLLAEMIYVFTPKGDVVELPIGATPVDFAYRIHSDVGDHTVGAIVNDAIVPLDYKLANNDIIKIKTNNNAKPNKDWLNFVKTSQAKNKIKSYFSKQERNFLIQKGKTILEKELRKKHIAFSDFINEANIKKLTTELKLKDLDELYLSIGSLRYTAGFLINLIGGDTDIDEALTLRVNNKSTTRSSYKNDIIVAGIDDILVNMAKCCNPVKGDDIVGFITKGQGITIHRRDCKNVIGKTQRIIDVEWNAATTDEYFSNITVETLNNKSYIADIIALITKKNIYINAFDTKEYLTSTVYTITLKIKEKQEIDKLLIDFNNLEYVIDAKRVI